ncbi:MAG: hypothetical protein FIA92_08205 [Chloroflexi bacterium]|nr:hypothetical protein [Chloroflexota bacterium]
MARIAAGDPGDPQAATGDEPYAGWFGDDYAEIDWSKSAGSIHDQVRAWAFAANNRGAQGPLTTLDGRRVRVTRTSLADPGERTPAVRMDCLDAPIWIVAFDPVDPTL